MTNIEQQKNSSELLQLVSFKIGNEEFGVDILNVQEINRMTQITKVPNAPDYVEGVINLRGRIIPVIDLRARIGVGRKENDKNTRIVVVEIQNTTIGFIVDAVKEVLRIPSEITEAPPEITTGVDSEFIKAVGKLEDRLLILLDLERILSSDQYSKIKDTVN